FFFFFFFFFSLLRVQVPRFGPTSRYHHRTFQFSMPRGLHADENGVMDFSLFSVYDIICFSLALSLSLNTS
ncbi:hypothetical protein GGR56DRAFT_653924, partial [Xylariaceae sp. FL0804]